MKTTTNPRGAGRKATGAKTFTIAFEADAEIKEWYDKLPKNGKSKKIREILKKYLTLLN